MRSQTGYPSQDKIHLQGVSFFKRHPLVVPISMFCAFVLFNLFHFNETAIEHNNRKYSKKQVVKDTIATIKALKAFGLKPTDRIALVAANLYEGIIVNLAANAIGVGTIFLNQRDTIERLADDIMLHQAKILVVDQAAKFPIHQVQKLLPSVQHTIYLKDAPKHSLSNDFISFETMLTLGNLYRKSVIFSVLRHLFNDQTTLFLQTSGSSGKSKTLCFSNRNIFASLLYCSNSTGIKIRDPELKRCLCILPYRLSYGWGMIFLNLIGGQEVILAAATNSDCLGTLHQLQANVIYGTPTVLRSVIDHTPQDADFSALKIFFSGGFLLPAGWYQEGVTFFKAHQANPQICNDYGIGESLCVGTTSKDLPHRQDVVGKFFVGPDWLIVDDQLQEVKYATAGEILVHSKSLCHGYFKDSASTAQAFIELGHKIYLRTGDYAMMDEQGIVTFIGRKKRFYFSTGAPEKIYCEAVENVILSSKLVQLCAVVPCPDLERAIVGKACVVLKDQSLDENLAREQLFQHLRAHLLDYQIPRDIVFFTTLPTLDSDKIDFQSLQELSF